MQLDLRRPTIVIAGAFNPAIFSPQWVAAVIHQVPEGAEVDVTMIADTANQSVRAYINGIGISVAPDKLSLAWDECDDASVQRAETLVRRIADALPHTPVAGVGINFQFQTDEFDETVVALLTPLDDPAKLGQVVQTDFKSMIKLSDCTLNFSRTIIKDLFVSDFNFHHDLDKFSSLPKILTGSRTMHLLRKAQDILEDLYKLDTDDITFIKTLNA